MGKYTSYNLRGWGPDGRHLSVSEKEYIQDWVCDYGVNDAICSHSASEDFIMCFDDTSFNAYDTVYNGLKHFARAHPSFLLELEYDCEDDDVHELTRFRGNDDESVRRIEFYPPFVNVKADDEGSPVPIPMIEFRFEEGDTVFALLQRMVSEHEINEIEDSIITYADVVQCQDHEKLVKDVLSSAGIGFWTVAPLKVFNV